MDATELAATIDHTLLAPTATPAAVVALVDDGARLGVAAVCVSPRWVGTAALHARGRVPVCGVVGFPSGAHRTDDKAHEAAGIVADGAVEIDMVASLGHALAGDWPAVQADIAAVRAAIPASFVLKVIIESAVLTPDQVDSMCRVAVDAGADFLKTSTGFHPSGGATVEAVARMRAAVGDTVGVKASGGIRDAATALAMLDAGASRLGASATAAILAGCGGGPG